MSTTLKPPVLKEIPLEQINHELPQPRQDLRIEGGENNRLLQSLKEDGLGSAITVVQIGRDKYKILNGHRRYTCARILGWPTIRCEVFPETADEAELERLRFNLQTNLSPWKPQERASELQRIKEQKKFKSNKALASYLHYPETLLSGSLALARKKQAYQKLMDEFKLNEAFQEAFLGLTQKIRPIPIQDSIYEPEAIMRNILNRIKYQVIKNAKDLRKLASVFIRTQANEKEILEWLKNTDLGVQPLYENTIRSGFLRDVENIMGTIDAKKNLDPEEDRGLYSLYEKLRDRYENA